MRLIDLDELLKFPIRIDHCDKEHGNVHFVYGVETVLEYAEYLPIVDSKNVVHGRWERVIPSKSAAKWSTKVSCSICHREGYRRYNYCFNCGAKMDLEVNNE